VTPEKPLAQKKKWARTHRTIPPRFDQAVNYTERQGEKQTARKRVLHDEKAALAGRTQKFRVQALACIVGNGNLKVGL